MWDSFFVGQWLQCVPLGVWDSVLAFYVAFFWIVSTLIGICLIIMLCVCFVGCLYFADTSVYLEVIGTVVFLLRFGVFVFQLML